MNTKLLIIYALLISITLPSAASAASPSTKASSNKSKPAIEINIKRNQSFAIGGTVDLNFAVKNAPKQAKICTTLVSVRGNKNFAFPGADGCTSIPSGNSTFNLFGTVTSKPGYDVRPGTYFFQLRMVTGDLDKSVGTFMSERIRLTSQVGEMLDCSIDTGSFEIRQGDSYDLTWDVHNLKMPTFYYEGPAQKVPQMIVDPEFTAKKTGYKTFIMSKGSPVGSYLYTISEGIKYNPICGSETQVVR